MPEVPSASDAEALAYQALPLHQAPGHHLLALAAGGQHGGGATVAGQPADAPIPIHKSRTYIRWDAETTEALVAGVEQYGCGNWKTILHNMPLLKDKPYGSSKPEVSGCGNCRERGSSD